MGGSKSKPIVEESARVVLAKRKEMLQSNVQVPKSNEPVAQATIKPTKIADLGDMIKVKGDEAFLKHKQSLMNDPPAAVIREKELQSLIKEQRRKGQEVNIFALQVPGKISEGELEILLTKYRDGNGKYSSEDANKEFGISQENLNILFKHVRMPHIQIEYNGKESFRVAS